MANKPFAIQGADLTLGGVNLQAGTTGVVIPGVTQATNYKVEEVEDIDDQTYNDFPLDTDVYVVDAAIYNAIDANQSIDAFGTYIGYTDDEGYIDKIEVDGQGTYTQQQAITASDNDMYVWIGTTGNANDRPLVPEDWVQIPFRPKMRAGEVETVGGGSGGGGVVERSVNYPLGESGDTKGTIALTSGGYTYICTQDFIEPQSDEFTVVHSTYAFSTKPTAQQGYTEFVIDFNDESNADFVDFFTNPSYQFDYQLELSFDGGDNWITTYSYAPHDQEQEPYMWFSFAGTPLNGGDEVTVRTSSYTSNIWRQIDLGDLQVAGQWINTPKYQGGEGNLELNHNNVDLWVENDDNSFAELWLHNNTTSAPHVDITVAAANDNDPTATKTWSFKHDGSLEFPDGSIQTTAYTGQSSSGGNIYIMANVDGTVITSTNGTTWSDPIDAGLPNNPSLRKVAIHNGTIVYATGSGLYYSTEVGVATLCTGTDILSGPGFEIEWNQVRYITETSKWVAVGSFRVTGSPSYNYPTVAHSTNGINWTVVSVDGDFVNTKIPDADYNWDLTDIIYHTLDEVYVISGTIRRDNDQGAMPVLYSGIFVTDNITTPLTQANHVDIDLNAWILSYNSDSFFQPGGTMAVSVDVASDDDVNDLWFGESSYIGDANNWQSNSSYFDQGMIEEFGYIPTISEVATSSSLLVIATVDGQVLSQPNEPATFINMPNGYQPADINDIVRNTPDFGVISAFTTVPAVGESRGSWTSYPIDNNYYGFRVCIDDTGELVSVSNNEFNEGYQIGDVVRILGSEFGGTDGAGDLVITVTAIHSVTKIGFTTATQSENDPADGERITISGVTSHSESGTTQQSYNGTFYIKRINDNSDWALYTNQAMTTPWETDTYWPVDLNTGTIAWNHGKYIDALGVVGDVIYVGNDDEQVFKSTDAGQTWTMVTDVTGDYLNAFAYGSISGTVTNELTNGSHAVTLNDDGTIAFPSLVTQDYGGSNMSSSPTLKLGNNDTSQVVITGPAATIDTQYAQRMVIVGQSGWRGQATQVTGAEGGDVYIWGGRGGEGTDNAGDGGDVKLRGGYGGANGGYVRLYGGAALNTNGNAGPVEIWGGDAQGPGGSGGNVDIRGGTGYDNATDGGQVMISAGNNSKHWTFNNTGDLELPSDTKLMAGYPGTGYIADTATLSAAQVYLASTNGNSWVGVENGQPSIANTEANIWLFNASGDLILPTGGSVGGDKYAEQVGNTVTIYTDLNNDQEGSDTEVFITDDGGTFRTAYPVGSTITFRNGEVRTIAEIGEYDGENYLTYILWTGAVSGSETNPRFPIVLKTANYADTVKPTLALKPDIDYAGQYGQYMELFAGGSLPILDNKHIHMKGHNGDVELFLGTDDNFVSTKEAGVNPAAVTLKSENDINVVNTNLRLNRKGSTWAAIYGDNENRDLNNTEFPWHDLNWNSVTVDEHGDYYVGGESAVGSDAIISKYSRDGSLIWNKYQDNTDTPGWVVHGVAYNDGIVASLVRTDFDADYSYYKLSEHDSATGESIRATDVYDNDGSIDAVQMIHHSTLGWVVVGTTFGETLTSSSITAVGNTGVGIIELPLSSTILDSRKPDTTGSWLLSGTNLTGGHVFGSGNLGIYKNVPVTTVTGTGSGARAKVEVIYTSNTYSTWDFNANGGTGYVTGDQVKILGSYLGGGVDGVNDMIITVTATDGVITGASSTTGTAAPTILHVDLSDAGYGSTDFSGGSFTVKRQIDNRAFVWTEGWTRYLDTANSPVYETYGWTVAEDTANGGLVVGGYTEEGDNGNSFVWKLAANGTTTWVRTVDYNYTSGGDSYPVTGLAVSQNGQIYAITSYTRIYSINSNGVLASNITPTGMWGMQGHIGIQTEDDGNEYIYAGGVGSSAWGGGANGFYLSKFTSDLDVVWGRYMMSSNDDMKVDYNGTYSPFVLGKGQATLVGWGDFPAGNLGNAIMMTISTADEFVNFDDDTWRVYQRSDMCWTDNNTGIETFNYLTAGARALTATIQHTTGNSFNWNNWAFQSRVLNFNGTTKGVVGVEQIDFVDGGVLDHNPSDIPPSLFFNPAYNNDWSYTLQLSDRGRFILNQTVPNSSYCENLNIIVPSNKNVAFPVGTVITLINASSAAAGGQLIYVTPEYYFDGPASVYSPQIWTTSGNQNPSAWSFQGIQTATLMKISTNAWILTCNDPNNED